MMSSILSINSKSGLLSHARYVPSAHCDDRPLGMAIDTVIIHGISLPPGQFGTDSVEKFFCGQLDATQHPYFATIAEARVSAHLFITRQGEVIQFVPFNKRAWHAGVSCFQGRERCNDFSIGIELEGTDDLPYEIAQYDALVVVLKLLMHTYPVTRECIVGHSDIAPGRKTDPGPSFDWAYLHCLLNK